MDEVNELQASVQQKRLFFALCNQLDWDSNMAKERVKKKYGLDSFANVSKDNLRDVIDVLQKRADNKTSDALLKFCEMHIGFYNEKDSGDNYKPETFPKYLAEQLMKYFYIRQK